MVLHFSFQKSDNVSIHFAFCAQCDQLHTGQARIHCKVPINTRETIIFLSSQSYSQRIQQPMVVKYHTGIQGCIDKD